jgi:predicted porin
MKKAVLAVIIGAGAGACAAQSNVTVYGLADLGVVSERGGAAGSVVKLSSGIANGSRLGFKGSEDLGGGLSALFTLEAGILADTGASAQGGLLFGRQAFVGLAGAMGTVRLGRQYTFIDQSLGALDPFYLGFAGRMSNVFTAGYVSRVDNSITYSSPVRGGFSGELAYGAGEVPGDASAKRYAGAAATYHNGPLYMRLAHQDSNTLSAAKVAGQARNTVLGATYDLGVVKAHAAYAVSKSEVGAATTLDSADLMLGATVPFGPHRILASYVRRDDKRAGNGDAGQIGVGYTYALSKRTTLYAAYAHIDNKNGAAYVVGNATEAGSGDQACNLGLRHTF